jgi:hypothetical protein
MSDTAYTKLQSQTAAQDKSETTVSAEVDKVIIGTVIAFTGVIGLWSVACLVSAMFQAGGPLQLLAGYFKALAGM